MRRALCWLSILFVCLLLIACSGAGPKKRVFPPSMSVQQLELQPDGRWLVSLRLQNFSNVPMRFDAVDATFWVGQTEVGRIALTPAIDVPGNSVEVLPTTLTPPAAAVNAVDAVLQSRAGIRYRLEGSIRSSEPQRRSDDFTFESSLTAVPGLTGVLR